MILGYRQQLELIETHIGLRETWLHDCDPQANRAHFADLLQNVKQFAVALLEPARSVLLLSLRLSPE